MSLLSFFRLRLNLATKVVAIVNNQSVFLGGALDLANTSGTPGLSFAILNDNFIGNHTLGFDWLSLSQEFSTPGIVIKPT